MNILATFAVTLTAVGWLTLLIALLAAIGSQDEYADKFYTTMINVGITLAAVGSVSLMFTGKPTV